MPSWQETEAMIQTAVDAEREACAKIADEAFALAIKKGGGGEGRMSGWEDAADHISATIRARQ